MSNSQLPFINKLKLVKFKVSELDYNDEHTVLEVFKAKSKLKLTEVDSDSAYQQYSIHIAKKEYFISVDEDGVIGIGNEVGLRFSLRDKKDLVSFAQSLRWPSSHNVSEYGLTLHGLLDAYEVHEFKGKFGFNRVKLIAKNLRLSYDKEDLPNADGCCYIDGNIVLIPTTKEDKYFLTIGYRSDTK